jgi:hypothetical protein
MRDGFEVYWMYLEDLMDEIKEGKPIILEVRDLSDFTRKVVRAEVKEDFNALSGAAKLWIRNLKDDITDQYWGIKVLEELPDDAFRPKRTPTREEMIR